MEIAALVISCTALVISLVTAFYTRQHSAAGVRSDLDELAVAVERVGKTYRRERMQRVRAAARGPEGEDAGDLPPPELRNGTGTPSGKEALRRAWNTRR